MDYALVIAGVVQQVWTDRDDTPLQFAPDQAETIFECPPGTVVGMIYEQGTGIYRVPAPHENTRIVTPLQFLNRIPAEVRLTIRGAARGTDANALAMEDFLDQLRLAQEVDLDSPVTISALTQMVAAGIMTEEQKDAILG